RPAPPGGDHDRRPPRPEGRGGAAGRRRRNPAQRPEGRGGAPGYRIERRPGCGRRVPGIRRTTMAKLSTGDLLDAFKEMTLLELSEFVKQFEETFNVSAAAPVAVAAGPAVAGDGAAAEAAEEQTEFDVMLESAGDKKI